ncbi:MAG: glutathione peroxidase [Cyclobacteriaceae bacterium]|nr:glutathione peroxidase [Cyclobacteriaceae bacterium]MBX2955040.1 glutathione peroxidase [Cyclobacteriaceae bacterium]
MKLLLTLLSAFMISAASVYDFKINSIDGELIDFSKYKGKTLLIVNVASKCGYTPQYADLEKLHETHGNKIVVLGFPANNFGGQEPGTNLEIAEFCQKNYGVKFQMFEKISVKGDDQHALYKFLKEKTGSEPSWNFCKYLVKPDGTVKFFASKVNPMDKQILDEIN